jgi:hydroxymethylbilane synthase
MPEALRIGTRGSPLALAQVELVRRALALGAARPIELCRITTTGDRVTDRPLAEIGGKALFTKEIDQALLGGEIDCAVHSMKDMQSALPIGLAIAAILERADPRDCLIGARALTPEALPPGSRLATSAVRRRAQLLARRPDLELVEMRGNVDTRLRKHEAGEVAALVLAKAGIDRLGRSAAISRVLELCEMLPAASQGAIAIVIRDEDASSAHLLAPLNHPSTALAVSAERGFLAALGGDCATPIAAHATIRENVLRLEGALFTGDGSESVRGRIEGAPERAAELGAQLAERLKALMGPRLSALFSE